MDRSSISRPTRGADLCRDHARHADDMYERMIAEALHTGILFYLSGLPSLLAGLAIVNLHNTWRTDWRVSITVLGGLMTIGGIFRIVVPQIAVAIGSNI